MKAGDSENTRSASKAWVRALSATASLATDAAPCLPLLLEQLAERYGAAEALTSNRGTLSYRALAQSAWRYARWGLAQGLGSGDVVALLMPNCPEYLAIWLGLTRIGAVVALLNTHIGGSVLAHCIRIVAPRATLVDRSLLAGAAAAREALPAALQWYVIGENAPGFRRVDLQAAQAADAPLTAIECAAPPLAAPALYIYTSGTTGMPKAAIVSHRRVAQWSHWFAGMLDIRPPDRLYNCLPMYHSIGGVVASCSPLVAGASVVVRERFSARDFWHDVVHERCTLFQYIGELCRYLLAQPPDPLERAHSLRLACGNGLRAGVWEAFQRRFAIPQILEYYASTEGNFSLYNCEGRPGAIGRIPPFLSHRLPVALIAHDEISGAPARDSAGHCRRVATTAVGEAIGAIQTGAQATGHFEGYADAEATERKILRDVFSAGDAWYRTGDLMRQDEQGYFYFVDRVGDTFRWKGENVSTIEVAGILAGCSGVRDAAVYGVTVPGTEGRAGMAALVVDESFDLQQLHRQLAAALPEYARPLFLRIVPMITITGTFKLNKQALMQQGYDPTGAAHSGEALYFADRAAGRYEPLDTTLHARLLSGQLRL
jgi:fatty-acyl-CoA synthase